MRAFTVREPWGATIAHLGKRIENRSRNIAGDYRGPVAITTSAPKADDPAYVVHAIATGRFDRVLKQHPVAPAGIGTLGGVQLVQGAVVAVAELVDVHLECDGHCGPWAEVDAWHLVLADVRALRVPVKARGFLGLWTLPDDLEQQVLEQIPAREEGR